MATYFSSANNQRETAPMIYLPGSYPEPSVLPGNMMVYMNSGSYSDTLAVNSQQQNNCIEIQSAEASDSTPQHQDILTNLGVSRIGEHDFYAWRDGRNEMLSMQSMGGPSGILHGGQSPQGQSLSLSLGTQIPSGIQLPPVPYQNPIHNPGFGSFLSPNPSIMGEGGDRNGSSRDELSRNAEYMPAGFPGTNQDLAKGDLSPYGMTSIARTIPNSKYLKAAQRLLDEVVNVRKALKRPDEEKIQSTDEHGWSSTKEGDDGSKNGPSKPEESINNSRSEISHAEKQELQTKLTKLLSMLDEVDKGYKQYYQQMQIVVSSFNVIAGYGAAKPYTELALQTISRHFRCLRDAINGQIQAMRKSLGEQETSENSKGVGITRLRYVDQHLRQQRALQQLGMTQHAWRPQRGLPESSVTILRAWLFEHFLHPYPKDSDKIMLARQTGLTRSQVSNWFINARVRLWKPMVEEMYKEELGDAEMDSNSSSENGAKAVRRDKRASEDRGEEMQRSVSSLATEKCSAGQLMDSKSDHVPDVELAGSIGRSNFQNGIHGESVTEFGLLKPREEQRPNVDNCSIFPDAIVHSDGTDDRFMAAAAAAAYQMPDVGRYGSGGGVSLTLGLQHCEGGSLPMSGTTRHSFVSMRGDDIYGGVATPSVGAVESTDFECINPGNRQHRFSSSHLLHDFVA
uniref:Homeobox domain-containing protein n=1 Tax=Rhizophora mucronata TaxID=61149 RepID=A0A2P2M123_RHIMU